MYVHAHAHTLFDFLHLWSLFFFYFLIVLQLDVCMHAWVLKRGTYMYVIQSFEVLHIQFSWRRIKFRLRLLFLCRYLHTYSNNFAIRQKKIARFHE